MQMTAEEICRHYTQASNKSKDIQVLADLNATDKPSIRAILIDGGVLPPDPPKRGRRPRADKPAEPPLTASPKEPKLKGIVCPNAVGGARTARRRGRGSDHIRTGGQDPGGPAGSGKPGNQNKGLQPRYEYAGGRHR